MSNLLVRELKRSKYRLLGLVGQGQFGRVYCAIHRKTGRLFALKELDRVRFPTHKFLRELRFLLSLQHPNIVTCHALEHTPTGRYLVMDYCEGGTLRNLMEGDLQLHPAQSLKLIADILAGLEHAHSRDIVHCDIKPENILLTMRSIGWTARISDFGIARLNQEMLKEEGGGNTGSPAYMAPERFYGQYSCSSDLYSVGILLFELLVGYRPFSGVPVELMSAHLNQPVKVPANVPDVLKTIILTALQKLQARRFRSAAEMLVAIQTAMTTLAASDPDWAAPHLMQPMTPIAFGSCQSLEQEQLQSAIRQLVSVPKVNQPLVYSKLTHLHTFSAPVPTVSNDCTAQICWTSEAVIGCQSYPSDWLKTGQFNPAPKLVSDLATTIRLTEPIQSLTLCPQGYFVKTARSLYLIASKLFQAETTQHGLIPQVIAEFRDEFISTIAPAGDWMAAATVSADRSNSQLMMWRLAKSQSSPLHRPFKFARRQVAAPAHVFQLHTLDSHHLAVFCHVADPDTHTCITGTALKVFTRRGQAIGAFKLPLPLRSVITTPMPYQFIAIEPGQDDSILFIDLKPLRVQRFSIGIVPVLLTTASWGYILAAHDGRLVLLDQYRQIVGRVAGPPNPTAMAMLDSHILLIATWSREQGCLHTIDLQCLELDFVF